MIVCSRRSALVGLAGVASPVLALSMAADARARIRPAADPWPAFRARYMTADGRILDTGAGGVSHSEGQGYGMILAEAAGDRASFDTLWTWTRETLLRDDRGLFSWRYDPSADPHVGDRNNATDGELLLAWGLLRGARRWREPAYAEAARKILAAVAADLVVQSALGSVLLPGLEGFRQGDDLVLNPSYWVWPALQAFAEADAQGPWAAAMAGGERLLQAARFGETGLPTDWVGVSAAGVVAPAQGRPPRYGYDAIRLPLYLAWAGRRAAALALASRWDAGPETTAPPAWIDVSTGERAPYAAAPGMAALARWIEGKPPMAAPAAEPAPDYYADALAALAQLAMREAPRG
jgi:endo-1,4-beta-D-glucanase Y